MFYIAALLANFYPFTFVATTCSKPLFFIIPPWYEYLNLAPDSLGQCAPVFQPPGDIFPVALAFLDMLLRAAGFIAVVSIIVAGVQYMLALGNPEKVTNARKRITNSLIGLAIAFTATLVVSFIGRQIGG